MRYYILDDDVNIVRILQNIVEADFNREVIGTQVDPVTAVDEILALGPDAVLVDYLMPAMDGVDVIKTVKAVNPSIEFIMISQVADKEMIGSAYGEGLSFFISKPINKIEVNVVLGNLEDRLNTTKKLDQIISLIGEPSSSAVPELNHVETAKIILRELGIYSEKGSKDMLSVIEIMEKESLESCTDAFERFEEVSGEKGKIIRQRMRRAVGKALRNLAYLGLEDYTNEIYVRYANSIFDFESVKLEMDHIRGIGNSRGGISIDRFLENLSDI